MPTYTEELVAHLRMRGLDEDRVRSIITEVDELGLQRASLERKLGTPAQYAERFPRGANVPGGRGVIHTGGILAVIWMIGAVIAMRSGWTPPGRPTLVVTLPALSLILAGMLASFAAGFFQAQRPLDSPASND